MKHRFFYRNRRYDKTRLFLLKLQPRDCLEKYIHGSYVFVAKVFVGLLSYSSSLRRALLILLDKIVLNQGVTEFV